ncbi:MAG: hypothetical protein GF311_02820 [Candidatus Lokiarchaeota archaeon]|nr:hypothetical protein [Candidatus Lokiarchaeota archaeon]
MDIKIILQEFTDHFKDELKRIIIYAVLILFFGFLTSYNIFRMVLGLDVASSWYLGSITTLISTLIIILALNGIWFFLKTRR